MPPSLTLSLSLACRKAQKQRQTYFKMHSKTQCGVSCPTNFPESWVGTVRSQSPRSHRKTRTKFFGRQWSSRDARKDQLLRESWLVQELRCYWLGKRAQAEIQMFKLHWRITWSRAQMSYLADGCMLVTIASPWRAAYHEFAGRLDSATVDLLREVHFEAKVSSLPNWDLALVLDLEHPGCCTLYSVLFRPRHWALSCQMVSWQAWLMITVHLHGVHGVGLQNHESGLGPDVLFWTPRFCRDLQGRKTNFTNSKTCLVGWLVGGCRDQP